VNKNSKSWNFLEQGLTTRVLHADRLNCPEHGSLHKPIHTSVAYGYEKAEDLAAVFQGDKKGFAYGRQGNPTLSALEHKVNLMEGGVGAVSFATGMAAIGGIFLSLLKKGDHVISSSYIFGNTNSLLSTLERMGVHVTFVDATSVEEVEQAWTTRTKMVFVETIANPVTQVADLEGIGELCIQKECVYIVDSTMTSPYLFQPKTVKASLIVHSLTKYIGGHGGALGGCVVDTGLYDWSRFENLLDIYKGSSVQQWTLVQIRKKGLRDFGGTMSPEDAHRLAIGAETLELRQSRSSSTALQLAELLEQSDAVTQVNYPGLPSHPQYKRAQKLFRSCGALLSFVLRDGIDCMEFLNHLNLVVNSSNLGDNRTLAIPVAHTIYFEMGSERRKSMGISESLIRLSVGIEDTQNLLEDFTQALKQCTSL
jgi:O-acetylhomoserine (thiol)-lyase